MNALLWFTLKYTFHRFQLTLVVLRLIKEKKAQSLHIFSHNRVVVTQLLILSVLWIKGGGKTTFQSLKFLSYKAYSLFYILCTFVYKYIHFK